MNIRNKGIMRVISLLKPKKFPYIIGLVGSCLIDASIPIISALVLKDITDAGVLRNRSLIVRASLLLCLVAFVFCVLAPLLNYLFAGAVKKVMAYIRLKVFYHIEEISIEYFDKNHSGDIISRFINDIGILENFYNGNMRSILSLVLTGIYSAIIMLILNFKMAAVLIIIGVITAYVNKRYAKVLRTISNRLRQNNSNMLQCITDLLAGFREVKMFNIGEVIAKKYYEANKKTADLSIKWFKKYAFLDVSNFILMWISNGITFIAGTILVFNGIGTVGSLLAMVLMVGNITNLFRQLGNEVSRMQISLAGAIRVLEIMDLPKESKCYSFGDRSLSEDKMIEMKDVTFSYKENETVVNGLNIEVEKGKLVALVGPSGGGKSTIIKLLLGLYPIESGSIIIDGKHIGEYTLEELRSLIAYVPQESYLFEGTIEENIRYGRMEATYDEIVQASKLANAHDFILKQSNGYQSLVGERGGKLSGGQKQRIAIARAFLKNSPILLLDEATSALDSESEQLIQEALNTLVQGKTTIAVAHRLSTIKDADIIYVIDKGKVVEQGCHKNLPRHK
ncbi:ABC-type multidrug transport system, ATPase and permease component [Hathewaya proteolytica DSM 3090]|uniref:ABC-type multidrug transport system, ATPase and permease component n=1 Tax=Hathewaya proteolytica DSM 3090 TaxID=1121331 RepID=A0A1M6MW53_9CLOT|nr:ABC transporter ATP-binding protein [Hathewaya proteolytica]SHJ87701.1 ABC-type multidrug transport system, ATPase and permease component [Hathewaya proteolytica DSM 3090]